MSRIKVSNNRQLSRLESPGLVLLRCFFQLLSLDVLIPFKVQQHPAGRFAISCPAISVAGCANGYFPKPLF